jgi:ESCRT-II complex subunit VPS25
MGDFLFPDVFQYPPFWTLQSHPETQKQQMKLWSNLICTYVRKKRQWVFDLSSPNQEFREIFRNDGIGRYLSKHVLTTIIDGIVAEGKGEWLSPEKTRFRILGKSRKEIGDQVWKWADDTGNLNEVMTVQELMQGGATGTEEFREFEVDVFIEALRGLVKEGRAKIWEKSAGADAASLGVKFLRATSR